MFRTYVFLKTPREGGTFLVEIIEDGEIVDADRDFPDQVMSIYGEVRKKWIGGGKLWGNWVTVLYNLCESSTMERPCLLIHHGHWSLERDVMCIKWRM